MVVVEREIINTYDQLRAAGGGVAICASCSSGRDMYFDGWIVLRVTADGKQLATDPDAAWYHNDHKWFSASAGNSDRGMAALKLAKEWVAKQGWCSGPWVRNRMRDYVPSAINKAHPIRREKEQAR